MNILPSGDNHMSKTLMMIEVEYRDHDFEKAVAVFDTDGGYVDMKYSGRYTFKTTIVSNHSNFLAVFLGKTLENVRAIITDDGVTTIYQPELLEPTDNSTDVFIYDDGTTREVFDRETTTSENMLDFMFENGITPYDFAQNSTTGKKYFYSTNPAIQEILEYNNVSPEHLKKRRLKEALHRSLLKGKQEIPDEYRDTYWNVYLSGNKTLMRQKKNSTKSNPPLVLHIPK